MAGLRPRGRATPPGVGVGAAPDWPASVPAEVSEGLAGSAWGRTGRAPWGSWSPCAVLSWGALGRGTLVRALPTASLARMRARRGNLLPKQLLFFLFNLKKKLPFREVKGLGCAVATELC